MSIQLRRAIESDAEAACEVVRRSIIELCDADHHDDSATLAAWLRNKTSNFFKRVISAESNSCVVAVLADKLCAFGHISHSGVIGLLYVAPDARFMGASTMMLEWLEGEARRLGVRVVTLESSLTARRFYEARGYAQVGEPKNGFGITKSWPMKKSIA